MEGHAQRMSEVAAYLRSRQDGDYMDKDAAIHCDQAMHELIRQKSLIAELEAARSTIAAYRDAEIEALHAKLADCQSVVRARGHAEDCWAERCVICGNPPSSTTNHYFGQLPSHNFQPGPCSCGHDRVVGVKP